MVLEAESGFSKTVKLCFGDLLAVLVLVEVHAEVVVEGALALGTAGSNFSTIKHVTSMTHLQLAGDLPRSREFISG